MSTLTEAVRNLAATRQSLADVSAQVRAAREAFDAAHAELLASQRMLAQQETSEAAQVKALAELAYAETSHKKPAPGVEIKLFATISYTDADALAWAQQTRMALVPESLDRKAFEKVAKATPLPFVTYREEPRVTIATDLAAALAAVTEPAAPAGV